MNEVTISMQSHTISRRRREFGVIHVLSRDGSESSIPAAIPIFRLTRSKYAAAASRDRTRPSANAPTRRTCASVRSSSGPGCIAVAISGPQGSRGPSGTSDRAPHGQRSHGSPGACWIRPSPADSPGRPSPGTPPPVPASSSHARPFSVPIASLRPRPAGHDAARPTENLPAIGRPERRSLLPGARLPTALGSAVF
jgi:hypothetical protein